MKGLSWINFILGLWLIVAPFVLEYRHISAAMWNSVVVGIVVAILAIYRALEKSTVGTLQQHSTH